MKPCLIITILANSLNSYLPRFQLLYPSLQSAPCIACFPPSHPAHLALHPTPPPIPTTLLPNSICSRENGNYTLSWRSSWSMLWCLSTCWPGTCCAWTKTTDCSKKPMNTPCTATTISIESFTPARKLALVQVVPDTQESVVGQVPLGAHYSRAIWTSISVGIPYIHCISYSRYLRYIK